MYMRLSYLDITDHQTLHLTTTYTRFTGFLRRNVRWYPQAFTTFVRPVLSMPQLIETRTKLIRSNNGEEYNVKRPDLLQEIVTLGNLEAFQT